MESLHNSGQPSLWENEWKWKTILYEGLVMDGSLLPPIVFTNCPSVPKGIEGDSEAKVIYVPDLNQPTAALTLRWLDLLSEYLEDNPLLVHDKGPEFTASSVQEDMAAKGIRSLAIPTAGGAFINPCDNPFNSSLKQTYFKQHLHSYTDKLKAIIRAYFSPSEETLQRYFQHVGWTGPYPTKRYVSKILNEGYRPGHKGAKVYEEMETLYQAWLKNLRTATLSKGMTFEHHKPPHTWYVWK